MKNKIFFQSLFVLLTLFLGSCDENIMNYKDPENYNTDSYFNTPDQIVQAANAIYVSFAYNHMCGWEWEEMFDVLANEVDATPAGYGEATIVDLWRYQHNNTNATITEFWRMTYKMILRSNLVIYKGGKYIQEHGEDPLVSRSMGEAYFLRGWAYFQLAFYWGRVPIRTLFNDVDNIDAPRAGNVADVWAVAEADFKKAQDLLPVTYDETNLGRATRGAATGFLGKLYLYTKEYGKAETEFNKIIGTQYSLLPASQWLDNFGEINENNEESIFEVQFYWQDGNFRWGNFTEPEGNGSPGFATAHPQLYSWTDWANWKIQPLRLADFIYNDESNNAYVDPRASLTYYGGENGDSTWCDHCSGGPIPFDYENLGNWYKKFTNKEFKPSENTLESGNNLRLMRYADVLLMDAECKLETGDLPGAIGLINQVRERIGAFPYTGSYSKEEMFNLLKRERQIEFMGEQMRFNDLKRWGILKETLNPELQAIFGSPSVQDKHYLFPIPQLEIETNLGLGSVADNWN
jgi:starch-binding outer membrane protein, SusD/RagB family